MKKTIFKYLFMTAALIMMFYIGQATSFISEGIEKTKTAYEEIEKKPLIVVKKDGRRENFVKEKVFNGIKKACEKLPISTEKISLIVDEIEQELRQRFEKEVASKEIGRLIIEKLRKIDEVAYVRFASVYRQFKDISEFEKEIEEMRGESDGTGKHGEN